MSTQCPVVHDGENRRCSKPEGHYGPHDCCTNSPRVFLDYLSGPALIFLADDGTAHILDRMPMPSDGLTAHESMSQRDLNILMALWETFFPRWRQR